MTSRERVLCAISHKNPDKSPVDFGGHRSSGIVYPAYKRLRSYLNLPERPLYIYDFVQQLAIVEDDVLDIVGADVVELSHGSQFDEDYWQNWEAQDGTMCRIPAFIDIRREALGDTIWAYGRCLGILKKGSHFVEQTYFPLLEDDTDEFRPLDDYFHQMLWAHVAIPPAPIGFDEAGMTVRRKSASALRDSTTRAIFGTFGGSLLETGQLAFRMDQFLIEIAANPKRIHNFLDLLTERHLQDLEKYLNAVGDYIDIIGFSDDLGMQTGPQISPSMYREFFKPRHAKMWHRVKEMCPHISISLHCCGGIYPLLPDLIDAGLEVINPVQFVCTGMALNKLKEEFGKILTFWGGGCDTQNVLPHGTPDEITTHVQKNIETLKPGGGFVFQQVHNILSEVPPENIMAMFKAVERYR